MIIFKETSKLTRGSHGRRVGAGKARRSALPPSDPAVNPPFRKYPSKKNIIIKNGEPKQANKNIHTSLKRIVTLWIFPLDTRTPERPKTNNRKRVLTTERAGPASRRRLRKGARAGCSALRWAASLGKKTDTYLLMNYNCSWKIFICYKYCCYLGHCKLNYFVVKNDIIISTIIIIMILIIINVISNVVIIIIMVILI